MTETPVPSLTIRSKDRGPLLDALRNGVVPYRGAHLIQVGRGRELEALHTSIKQIKNGAGAVGSSSATTGPEKRSSSTWSGPSPTKKTWSPSTLTSPRTADCRAAKAEPADFTPPSWRTWRPAASPAAAHSPPS